MPQFISTGDDIYGMPGFLRAFQLFDVAFFYLDKKLYHYQGMIGGWSLWKTVDYNTREEAEAHIEKWCNS